MVMIPGQATPFNIFCLETVHGGLLLSLVDTVGSLAVATRGLFMTGVSTGTKICITEVNNVIVPH
jgi:acyl-coenzyme A thioesterase PaaI-like protein